MVNILIRACYILGLVLFSFNSMFGQAILRDTNIYIEVENARLFVRIVGSGKPIVIVHGGPGMSHDYLAPQLIELLQYDYQLIFFDQRASGKSSGVDDTSRLNMTQLTDDLERIRQHFKIDRLNLLGHSFGGLLAMYYAFSYPDRIEKLLLIDTSPASWELNFPHFRKTIAERQTEVDRNEITALERRDDFGKNPELMDRYFKLYFKTFFKDPSLSQKIALGIDKTWLSKITEPTNLISKELGKYDIHEKLPKITATTLVLHGDYSVISMDGAKAIAKKISNSKLVVLKDVGHFPYIEAPDKFSMTIKEFLGK